jgi:outer membrane receptor protein involved in Fe transport
MSGNFNYENPLAKNRTLEAGCEIEFSPSIDNSPIDTFNFDTQEFLYVAEFSNNLDQKTISGALYTTYSDTLGFLNYKAGLRYEFASLDMVSVALTEKLHRTYSTFFPTLHLSTTAKNNDNYSLSYSRRVQYPQWGLDPFINRVDGESIYGGNPYLDPAFTDAFEAGYAHFFKSGSSISATIYHRRTNLDITKKSEGVLDTLLNRYTIYTTFINAGKKIFTGADLTFTWRPKPAYRIMFNANLYNQDFNADLGSYTVDKHDLTYDGKLIFMWNYKIIRLNIMGIYRASAASLQGSNEPTYFINATASADLFKKMVSLRLGMNDIFNWMKHSSETNTPSYISSSSSKQKSQFLTFGITVRLGKVELEQSQMPPQNSVPQ